MPLTFLLISCASAPQKQEIIQMEDSGTPDTAEEYMEPVIVNGVIDFTDPMYSFLLDTSPDNGALLFSSFIPMFSGFIS